MKTEAENFVAYAQTEIAKIEAVGPVVADGYTLATVTDLVDEQAPWTWPWSHWGLDPEDETTCIEDLNGEDVTAVFSDGSRAKWVNRYRHWEILKDE